MKLPRRKFLRAAASTVAGAVALPALSRIASASDYPTRPVRIIVGFAAGGAPDILARLCGQWLSERLGQSFVIENRTGAGGNIATEAVVQAPPDGYTLLLASTGNTVNVTLYNNLNYDFLRDVTPVAGISREPLAMEVNPSLPVTTVPEFIAYAKANPGKINYGSAGIGSSLHMAGELFNLKAGVKLVHVPYRGGAQTVQSLLSGEVELMWDTPAPTTHSFVADGKLRALAVMSNKRLSSFSDVPAIGELGYGNDLEVQAWQGVLVRSGTPAAIVDTLYQAIAKGMALDDPRQRIAAMAVEPMATDPAAFEAFFTSEVKRWTDVARAAGIEAQ